MKYIVIANPVVYIMALNKRKNKNKETKILKLVLIIKLPTG